MRDKLRIIREHRQWWIIKKHHIPHPVGWGYIEHWTVVGNVEGSYEDALAEFYRLLNNYRAIRKNVLEKAIPE